MGRSTVPRIQVVCRNCGTVKWLREKEVEQGRGKFCNPQCFHEHQSSFVDERFFSDPNPQMAYVLGLIVSDGCIIIPHSDRGSDRKIVSIKSIDRPMLEMVMEMMGANYSITNCGLTQAGNTAWRIGIANRQIVEDVIGWGVTQRKTLTATFPPLPDEVRPDFVRGLFDGDGSVGSYRYGRRESDVCGNGRWSLRAYILGTHAVLEPIPSVFGVSCKIVPRGKISKLVAGTHEELVRMYNSMYYAAGVPCLVRKRDVFDEVLDVIAVATEKPRYGREKAALVQELLGKTGRY